MPENKNQIPKTVSVAIRCIWASFFVTVFSWVIFYFLPPPKLVKAVAEKIGVSVNVYVSMKLGSLIIAAIIIYFVLKQIENGKKWARIVCLITGITALPSSLFRFLNADDAINQSISAVLNILYLGFGYYALYLLFNKPGNEWFRKLPQRD